MICPNCNMVNLSVDCKYCPRLNHVVGQDVGQTPTSSFGLPNPFDLGYNVGKQIPTPYDLGRQTILGQTSNPSTSLSDKLTNSVKGFGVSLETAALYIMLGGLGIAAILAYWSYKTDAMGKAHKALERATQTSEENRKLALKLIGQ